MIPGIFDKICTDSLRADRFSSLAHAAECLAIAAGTLSQAARAAAEALALEPVRPSETGESEGGVTCKDSLSGDSDISTVPPLNLILLNPAPDPVTISTNYDIDHAGEEAGEGHMPRDYLLYDQSTSETRDEELEAPEAELGNDIGGGLNASSVEMVERLEEVLGIVDANPHDGLSAETSQTNSHPAATNPESSVNPEQTYRILVGNELDVLTTVCALIGKHQRVVCYMPCGTPPLLFYKQLIEGVNGIPAYFAERMSAPSRDAAYKKSLQKDSSVVLMPSTLSSDVVMEGDNTWVIHMGWPSNREKYSSQVKSHQAKNNVIVACSSDLDLYSSRTPLMCMTQDWPKLGSSFTTLVGDVRPLVEDTLAKLSDEVKEKVYADWIQSHGVYGPRYVESWDSITLVEQANHYLLHVLQYGSKNPTSNVTKEIFPPEVSAGFVSQNLLDSAVQAGVLHIKYHDAGLNHISSLVQADLEPITPTTNSNMAKIDTPIYSFGRAGIPSQQEDFTLITGHTYFAIEEEFDAIPLICLIAEKHNKTVCFLERQGSLRHYQKLFSKILEPVSVIAPEVTNSDKANQEAASRFANSSTPAVFLLTYSTTNLPPALREKKVGCCVYWGFHLPLKQAKKHRDQLVCTSTTIIMTKAQRSELQRHSTDIIEHPGAQVLLDLGPRSLLWTMRNTTISVLMSEEATTKGLYVNRIYGLGAVTRAERSAEEVVRIANQYAAKTLLRGTLDDGSNNFPPVAGRLPIPRTVVERFSLQPAINTGLALIG